MHIYTLLTKSCGDSPFSRAILSMPIPAVAEVAASCPAADDSSSAPPPFRSDDTSLNWTERPSWRERKRGHKKHIWRLDEMFVFCKCTCFLSAIYVHVLGSMVTWANLLLSQLPNKCKQKSSNKIILGRIESCWFFRFSLTDPFTTLELQNTSHDVSVLRKIRRSPDCEALKLWRGWSAIFSSS